jgi:hypothetical protein
MKPQRERLKFIESQGYMETTSAASLAFVLLVKGNT